MIRSLCDEWLVQTSAEALAVVTISYRTNLIVKVIFGAKNGTYEGVKLFQSFQTEIQTTASLNEKITTF